MNTERISFGSAPYTQYCCLPGAANYEERSVVECTVFRRMLLRLQPIPWSTTAAVTIENCATDPEIERKVCVRFRGKAGWDYARHLLEHIPRRWDDIALREITWYCRRRLFALLVHKGLTPASNVPVEFQAIDPLFGAEEPDWPGVRRTGSNGCVNPLEAPTTDALANSASRDLPTASMATLVLGPVDSTQSMGMAVRSARCASYPTEVTLYSSDLTRPLTAISIRPEVGMELLGENEFYVERHVEESPVLTAALFSRLFEVTARFSPPQLTHARLPVWRIKPSVMQCAVPVCLRDGAPVHP